MNGDTKNTIKTIELRSERVRNIIGEVPPFLIRGGIGVIAAVVILVAAICSFIPMYDTAEGKIKLITYPPASLAIAAENGIFYKFAATESNIHFYAKDTVGYIKTDANLIFWYTAEIAGQIFINAHSGDRIQKGDCLFAVIPDSTNVHGQLILPYNQRSKIRAGQDVMIELEGFPSREFGVIRGRTNIVYPLKIYNNSGYEVGLRVDVVLPQGTTTTYKKDIRFSPDMEGIAKVILSKQSVLSKVLLTVGNRKHL